MEKATVGQFHDFFGRLLSKMTEEKIKLIDKAKNQEGINLLCSKETDERVINEFIRFINNGCKVSVQRLAQLFHGVRDLIIGKYSNHFIIGEASVMEFFKPLFEREIKSGFPQPIIRRFIWGDFEGVIIDGFAKDFKCCIYLLLYEMKLTKIIEMAECEMIMEVYSFIQGLSIIRQAAMGGILDTCGRNIIVTVEIPENNSLFRLRAGRDENNQLLIDYFVVDNDYWSPSTLIALKPFQII